MRILVILIRRVVYGETPSNRRQVVDAERQVVNVPAILWRCGNARTCREVWLNGVCGAADQKAFTRGRTLLQLQTLAPTLTHDLDLRTLPRVKLNQHAKRLGQRSFTSKVIVRTQSHTRRTDCSIWTTKMDGKTTHNQSVKYSIA